MENLYKHAHKVLQGSAQPIDRPAKDHVDFAPGDSSHQLVETRALISALGTADALVPEDSDDFPTAPFSNGREFALLIADGLVVR